MSGRLRVVAGEVGGRRLVAPPGTTTRPTSERVREAMFNALDSLGAVDAAVVLDLFAGSGALGIEALSRGAGHVTFVDRDRSAIDAVQVNLASTGLAERATVVAADALTEVRRPGPLFDLVLIDPPYGSDDWPDLLTAAAARLTHGGIIVAESGRDLDPPSGLAAARSRRYGSTVVTFVRPCAEVSPPDGDHP